MIQDTTPYSAFQSLSGAGGGNWGAGVNASTGGMASILQQNAAQNQGLNVSQQEIANQQAQELLAQEQAKTPAIQAQQGLATTVAQNQQNVEQTGGLATKQAEQAAAQAKAYNAMTSDERSTFETHMKSFADAKQWMDTPGYDNTNAGHRSKVIDILDKGGYNIDPTISPEELKQKVNAGANIVTNNLDMIRQQQLASAKAGVEATAATKKGELEIALANIHGAWTERYGQAIAGRTPQGAAQQLIRKAQLAPDGLDSLSALEFTTVSSELTTEKLNSVKSTADYELADIEVVKNFREVQAAKKDDPKKALELQRDGITIQEHRDNLLGPAVRAVNDALRKKLGSAIPPPGMSDASASSTTPSPTPAPTPTPSTFAGSVGTNGSAPVIANKATYDALPKGAEYSKPGDPPGTVRKKL